MTVAATWPASPVQGTIADGNDMADFLHERYYDGCGNMTAILGGPNPNGRVQVPSILHAPSADHGFQLPTIRIGNSGRSEKQDATHFVEETKSIP
jgi:hypothetical protein